MAVQHIEKITLRNTLRMTYQVPTAAGYSQEHTFQTADGEAWGRAVNTAHEKGYRITKVERLKED